jgi:hypothetical protein
VPLRQSCTRPSFLKSAMVPYSTAFGCDHLLRRGGAYNRLARDACLRASQACCATAPSYTFSFRLRKHTRTLGCLMTVLLRLKTFEALTRFSLFRTHDMYPSRLHDREPGTNRADAMCGTLTWEQLRLVFFLLVSALALSLR